MSRRYWETKDGKRIPITKLDDGHLDNIIALLERAAKAQKEQAQDHADSIFTWFGGGDTMAAYYAEQSWDAEQRRDWEDHLPEIYRDLVEEREKRAARPKPKAHPLWFLGRKPMKTAKIAALLAVAFQLGACVSLAVPEAAKAPAAEPCTARKLWFLFSTNGRSCR